MNTHMKSTGKKRFAQAGVVLLAALFAVGVLGGVSPAAAQGADEDYPLRQRLVDDLISIVTSGTGLSESELLTAVLGGQNLGEIIAAQGANVDAISAQLNAAAVTDINAAVADGTLTQPQADKLLARVDSVIGRILSGSRGRLNPVARLIHTVTTGALVDEVAHQTGLTLREVNRALRDGQTLTQITTENGGDPALVVSRAVERVTRRVNTLVERGRLTQAQADGVLNGLAARFHDEMNQVHPFQVQAQ